MSLQCPLSQVEGRVPRIFHLAFFQAAGALLRGAGPPSLDPTRKDALRRGLCGLRPPCPREELHPQPCHGPRGPQAKPPRRTSLVSGPFNPKRITVDSFLLRTNGVSRVADLPDFPDSALGCSGGLRTPGTRSPRKTSILPVGETQDVGLLSSPPPSAASRVDGGLPIQELSFSVSCF